MYYSLLSLKMISLFYSPTPRSQVSIFIYRNSSIHMQHARVAVAIGQLHAMTSFYHNYKNSSVCCFLVRKAHLSGHFSIFGLVFFVLKSLLGIVRQRRRRLKASESCQNFNISLVGYWDYRYFNSGGLTNLNNKATTRLGSITSRCSGK